LNLTKHGIRFGRAATVEPMTKDTDAMRFQQQQQQQQQSAAQN